MKNYNIIITILILIASFCLGAKNQSPKQSQPKTFQHFLSLAEAFKPPASFIPDILSTQKHRSNVSTAVFSVGLLKNFSSTYSKSFLGTLRKTGFDGDIVIALAADIPDDALQTTLKYDPILYFPRYFCFELPNKPMLCGIEGFDGQLITLAMLRYYMYLWWASKYEKNTIILVADFRDVFFQSNPFNYLPHLWSPPVSHLAVFLEALPLKMIYRCPYNSGWIKSCYGKKALQTVSMNPVSCSGTTIGSRDGIMIYSFMMVDQVQFTTRAKYGYQGKVPDDQNCISIGMDQGLHNWLLHSGKLKQVLNVKAFHQGEGPINTIGSFYPQRALVKLDLKENGWNIFRGEVNDTYFVNWNNDLSPVVHQYDRFLIVMPNFTDGLRAMQGL